MLQSSCLESIASVGSCRIGHVDSVAPVFGLSYSHHARLRKNQRCKRNRLVDLLLEHFDRDVYLSEGKWAWSVSAERCDQLRVAGLITAAEADRLPGLVIVNAEDGIVVTLVRGKGRRLGPYLARQ